MSWDTVNAIAMDAIQMIVAPTPPVWTGYASSVSMNTAGHTPAAAGKTATSPSSSTSPPVRDGTGGARLLDLVPGRSAAALTTWLAEQRAAFRDQVEVVAMDGFAGYKTAAADQLPEATPVMDPFHVVALAGVKLDLCRQCIQQQTCGHRGRTGDPLYGVRRILRTRLPLLNARRKAKLGAVSPMTTTSPSNCAGASTNA